jgi:hypothetical protein
MPKTLLATLLMIVTIQVQSQDWQSLMPTKKLEGWKQLGGEATYKLKDGVIVGTTVGQTPNSFLVTEKTYEDFILEFEVWVDPEINSGVQIRSNSLPEYQNGRVHGYQVELDPSPRAYSGGIYDEGRRFWLYPLSRNPKGSKAFRNGVWNKVRVEAIRRSIRTWVNGVQCANLTDDMTARGFIGLQVHSVKDELVGREIKWRNIRIITGDLAKHRTLNDPEVPEISYLVNRLSDYEYRSGWRLLWDGKTSYGWRSARGDQFPESGWTMEDGILTVLETDGGESTGPGDISLKSNSLISNWSWNSNSLPEPIVESSISLIPC